jgi:hypothetical protein
MNILYNVSNDKLRMQLCGNTPNTFFSPCADGNLLSDIPPSFWYLKGGYRAL